VSKGAFDEETQSNNNGENKFNTSDDLKNRGVKGYSSSYVNVVKGSQSLNMEMETKPALILDNSCMNQRDYSNSLMGKVKDIASLTTLKVVLGKGFWVRAKEISGWLPDFEEENEEETDMEDEINGEEFIDEVRSEDPLNLYDLLNRKTDDNNKNTNEENSLKFPPDSGTKKYCLKKNAEEDVAESMCSGYFQKAETPSASVGNSGRVLCMWDPKSFKKLNVTGSDYFVIIRGVWMLNGRNILIISMYAPQELTKKKMLWDYLSYVIENWNGEVIIMGDYNEVRTKAERFGSMFNVQGADAFNMFISNTGLEEVPLCGCSFTWCHKYATKTSKLDRFLFFESLMSSCPNISAVLLDRYLSDHRPILLRESHYDYGHVPFRFFTIGSIWRVLINLEKLQSLEAAQKAKIKWAIEGDEITKYYHGILNKKKSQIAIRGILADGNWIESPDLVKSNLVNEVQSTFLVNRQILDGSFILNKILQWCKSKKKKSLVSKVDFEKAYDSIQWDYLGDLFRRFSFGDKWCGWIQNCLRSSRGSVIVNGRATEEFQFYKGLKQGDPLSPFLFILVMESLHISFQRLVDAETIVHVLECFHHASWLRINMSKSKLLGISVDVDKVDQAARKIGCVTLKAPFTYLGSKVSGLMSRIQSWKETVKGDGRICRKAKSSFPSIWLDIVHEVELFKDRGTDLVNLIHKKLGNGQTLCFGRNLGMGPRGGVEQTQFDSMLEKVEGDENLRELSGEEAWEAIENFAKGQKEWDNPPNIISEQEIENLKVYAKRLFGNENVWVEMHRNIAWDKVDNPNPQSTPQVPPSFEETTLPVTYPEEVEETLGTPIEVEPLDETQLEDLGLNICNHDIPLSNREVPSFDEPEPQPNP
ncbi:RNA-directed DNA polymerase, eukaryota, reverse transcriptase zinc-binding domain protein, partial [Tanacetum coccineum]